MENQNAKHIPSTSRGTRGWLLLTREQLCLLLKTAGKHGIGRPLWFALCMGMRQGELLSLRWSDLNTETRTLSVHRTRVLPTANRSDEEEIVPSFQRTIMLPPSLLKTLLLHQQGQREICLAEGDGWDEKGLIFSTAARGLLSPAHIRHALQQVCSEAALPALRFHDVRHNTVHMLVFLGVGLGVVQAMLGFKGMYSVVKNLAPILDLTRFCGSSATFVQVQEA